MTNDLTAHLNDGAEEVFLPPNAVASGGNRTTILHAARPEVAAAAREYFEDPDRLHGDRVPSVTVLTEKPVHRMMIMLHAMGKTQKEIAEATGYSAAGVGQILRQPWARQRLLAYLKEAGQDAIQHFLKNETSNSLEVLREIRDDAKERGATRVAAANAILDRALGKPIAKVETDNTNRTVPADISSIEAEISRIREQLKAKGVPDGGTN